MKHLKKTLAAGVLAISIASSFSSAAFAEVFQRTITLGPGAGNFNIEDLGVGDTMVLTLVNPTNRPLVFETTENIGNQKSWTIQPGQSATVDFTYTKPFDDDVEFVVKELGSPDSPAVAQGVLIHGGQGGQMQQGSQVQTQPVEQPAAYQTQQSPTVRGYW